MTILIIDDDINKVKRIEKSLLDITIRPYDTTHAKTFIDAKRLLKEFSYDLIICDMQFPNRIGSGIIADNGIKVLEYLKRKGIETTIVIASSSDTVDTLLADRGFSHIPSIKASSMYSLDNQLEFFINT